MVALYLFVTALNWLAAGSTFVSMVGMMLLCGWFGVSEDKEPQQLLYCSQRSREGEVREHGFSIALAFTFYSQLEAQVYKPQTSLHCYTTAAACRGILSP